MAKRIELTQGYATIVDDCDYEYLSQWSWYANVVKPGYVRAIRAENKDGKRVSYKMHRVIMNAPQGMFVDHLDMDPLRNTRDNLRLCTHAENLHNSRKRAASVYKGVIKTGKNGRWSAYIQNDHLGTYSHPVAAAMVADEESRQRYGEFARPNFDHYDAEFVKLNTDIPVSACLPAFGKYGRGVYLPNRTKCVKKFQAQITVNSSPVYLGVYETRDEAARVYDAAARLCFGDVAYVNFPDEPENIGLPERLLKSRRVPNFLAKFPQHVRDYYANMYRSAHLELSA